MTHDDLQLFLGKATYYGSFIPDLSARIRPLRDMILNKKFQWTAEAERSYIDIKNALISPQVLVPYNPQLPLLLATDASSIGLGAVLSHRMPDGCEKPIAYASRTLTATERRYPQIDKEALAIVWAVQKFFLYVYARHFTLITDHKPLSQIFDPYKSLPVLCISRMANYANFLGNFDFDVLFKRTKDNANADYCSRALKDTMVNNIEHGVEYDDFDSFIIQQINQLPINAEKIAQETRKDTKFGKIIRILESGKSLHSYGYKSPEINYRMAGDCLIFEHRVVIPEKLRNKILQDLHAAHLGIVKMKGIARSFVYWPGIDRDIEAISNNCSDCAKHANDPPKFNEHHWQYPGGPWERIHLDFAGPILGSMIFVVTDAYSKWIDVKITSSCTSSVTINILDELFASYGVPVTVVSDNGACFASAEFKEFLTCAGVKFHRFTAPYHPSTNGQAERSVQTVKNALKSLGTHKNNLQRHLNMFLQHYRIAPHSTTGKSPASLFLGRTLRTRLNLLLPQDLTTKMTEKQYMKFNPAFRSFESMQDVYFLSNNTRMDKWLPGVIINRYGDLHYDILYNGKRFKRHIDQIRERKNRNEKHYKIESRPRIRGKNDRNEMEYKFKRRRHFPIQQGNKNSTQDNPLQENPPNDTSKTQSNTSDDDDMYAPDFSTPQSSFCGFDSPRENNAGMYSDEFTQSQNEVNVGDDPDTVETEANIEMHDFCIPLRRSSRVRKQPMRFSPE